jgi:hypothetical protein
MNTRKAGEGSSRGARVHGVVRERLMARPNAG